MTAWLNGRYLPLEEARVPVEDRGFQFGDGVYEVIRVYRTVPFRLDRHLARLGRSLKGVGIVRPEPESKIREICLTLAGPMEDGIVYLQVTRGVAPRSHDAPRDLRPTFLAYGRLLPARSGKGVALRSVADNRWGRCDLKTICLLPNVLARREAADAGADDALFVRADGTVTEAASSNVFMVRGGAIVTHPADHRILNGVTRDAVIEAAGGGVEERPFTIDEARAADELFLTGTTTEVGPATALDGRPVGSGEPGPVALRLAEAFRDLVKRETR